MRNKTRGVVSLTGADLVLPDRVASGMTLIVEGDRIADITSGAGKAAATSRDLHGSLVVPGFIDVHMHGALGTDVLDGVDAVGNVAQALPRWGVTAFCPTSVACAPGTLSTFLGAVSALRSGPQPGGARVLPAHLESNFINPDYRGAQPFACLRSPAEAQGPGPTAQGPGPRALGLPHDFSAADILAVIDRHQPDVGIVTLAPELPGGLDLVRRLREAGVRVALGHSGATFDEAQAAIGAGACHATHLFNRMRPMTHRDPGIAGAVLASDEVAVEIIGDGLHVHPAMMRMAIAAKGPSRVMAVTDATAGSGLPAGSRARLGGQSITVSTVARLDDGTMAGSVATMDRVFACLINECGCDLVRAADLCATTPARELGLHGYGALVPGAAADFVVLSRRLEVVETWIAGGQVWRRSS
jgi:N-acetylglucosamine-6-phosphate deacetylase